MNKDVCVIEEIHVDHVHNCLHEKCYCFDNRNKSSLPINELINNELEHRKLHSKIVSDNEIVKPVKKQKLKCNLCKKRHKSSVLVTIKVCDKC
jgi:hypothetical protein